MAWARMGADEMGINGQSRDSFWDMLSLRNLWDMQTDVQVGSERREPNALEEGLG